MFKKVLVANRGEIAVRVLRACRELGLESVAVWSEVDRNALHVRYADEAYCIGPAPARESYLRIDRIIDVAIRAKADAIHPGYGFLAENDHFARACVEAGIVFVGPPPEVIRAMGDKIQARRTVSKQGVPGVPGTYEPLRDEEMLAAANQIGFPLFIKAAAGGGGKGMRRVDSADELAGAIARARSEAESAFGDATVYLEKIIEHARHVEFQILADARGNVIHLGERECSIQRRHQKLVEESPSVALDEKLREKMGKAAVAAAKAANYVNAGTIEFLLDKDEHFYFLEMNTRLQVEHPVTELVTGIDIVKEQLRIASGRPLSFKQKDIQQRGWAIECRVTAEDPYNGFLPSTGRIISLYEPTGPGVRLETGVYEGFEVGLYYDPLIAKLVVWGPDRAAAIMRMKRALSEYKILGIATSIPFHQKLFQSTSFIVGHFDTTFLDDRFSMEQGGSDANEKIAAIVATLLTHDRRQHALNIPPPTSSTRGGWRRFRSWEGVP
ncbi:MAG: acetyl-CoA carboxylase biotin carboxylase subunit [Chloroflexota bacterium]|nr:acetyl-CoA carboxylase biotin carboxylase subunit [Chloroflexota bacterium]